MGRNPGPHGSHHRGPLAPHLQAEVLFGAPRGGPIGIIPHPRRVTGAVIGAVIGAVTGAVVGAREPGVAVNGPVRETIWSGLGAVSGEAGAINGAEIDPERPVGPVHRPDGNPLKTDGNGDPAGKGTAPVVEAVS